MSEWKYLVKEFYLDGEQPTYKEKLKPDKLSEYGGKLQSYLNELGKEGWEVIYVQTDSDDFHSDYKRTLFKANYRIWAKRRAF